MFNFVIILAAILFQTSPSQAGKVIYAVNAGGDNHVDSTGITYLADPLTVGVSSDYGRRQPIVRSAQKDNILYQTERWHDQSFSYEVPVKEDGDYVLVLKFAEVYFYGPNLKMFNVLLNDQHTILQNLDIFSLVGHSTAHDEVIPLSIKKGKLSVMGEYSTFNGVLKVEFVKGMADNPKICAFYLMKGTPEDVPKLPELKKPVEEEEEEEEEEVEDEVEEEPKQKASKKSSKSSSKSKVASGPPAADPYAEDSSSLIMPIMIAFALFVPTLACLCRL
ncbi:malectin-B-like [Clavelina lepadiformis]|uniref:Malectin domain-containing protein n=1 Tax=Clavelina lepadiformis TaxID=159417 RepID=A0ABP0FK51_CLALP